MKNSTFQFILIVLFILTSSCSPRINTYVYQEKEPLKSSDPVVFFTLSEPTPTKAVKIGELDFDPELSMKCKTDEEIETLKEEARKIGANAVKITSAVGIDNESCIQAKADLLILDNPQNYHQKDLSLYAEEEEVTLFIYRLKHMYKRKKSFTILLNDKEIGVLDHASKQKIIVPEGIHVLSIKEIENSQINFNAKKGTANYLRLYFKGSYTPTIELKNPITGRLEYESFDYTNNEKFEDKYPADSLITEVETQETEYTNLDEKNFFKSSPSAEKSEAKQVVSQDPQVDFSEPVKQVPLGFRASASVGYGYRLGRIDSNVSPQVRSYLNDLKSGLSLDFNTSFYFDGSSGIGIKFNQFLASAEADNFQVNFPGFAASGNISTNETMTYIGIAYQNRLTSSNNKNELHTGIGIGYFRYLDKSDIGNQSFELVHETLGVSGDISYDIFLGSNFYLGLQAAYFFGNANKATLTTDSGQKTTIDLEDNKESFNRIDFSIGLRYIIN